MRLFAILLVLLAAPAVADTHRPANALAGEASLYLRQHAFNAVDWHPWGAAALERARAENKPVFVSVGYAACHWCHVMAGESFDDEAIAAALRAGFIAIKIDRDRRPDLDEQFMLATSALAGQGGWPNNLFLTPDGDPFYAFGYLPRDTFQGLIAAAAAAWAQDEAAVRAQALAIAHSLRRHLDPEAVSGAATPGQIHAAATGLLAGLDEFHGGFGVAPKFPREEVLLMLLDQAQRTGDAGLVDAVALSARAMMLGGIHDHVGGGYHRYAVDPAWTQPHFEKMLYNQALVARVLLRLWAVTGDDDLRRTAERTLDFVLSDMRLDAGGFAAALDAVSPSRDDPRAEGAFYLWPRGADVAPLQISDTGVLFALPGALADAPLLARLADERRQRPPPLRDDKLVLGWNGEMIVTLAEAGILLERDDYTRAAARAAGFILDRMWPRDGLRRSYYDARAEVAAQLADYGAFGRGLLALDAAEAGGRDWLGAAQRLADEMQARLGDPGQPMRMTPRADGLGPVRPLDDTEIAGGNAQALMFLSALDRRLGLPGQRAQALASVLALDALQDPMSRAATLRALAGLEAGGAGPVRISYGGALRVVARPGPGTARLEVTPRPGWHVNAAHPLEDYLIPTHLTVNGRDLEAPAYPDPVTRRLGFSDRPLALYESPFTLAAALPSGAGDLALDLQACNDRICLAPETMLFRLWTDK